MRSSVFLVPAVAFLMGAFISSPYADEIVMIPMMQVMRYMVSRPLAYSTDPFWHDGSLRLITCGTGTPIPDKTRASQCMLVSGGGKHLLFDAGAGSAENLMSYGVPNGNLSAMFITHFHSDHIADFGQVVLQRWLRGAKTPLDVYGPPGVERVVKGYQEAMYLDSTYRIAHHTPEVLHPEGWKAIPHVVDVCGTEFNTLETRFHASKKCSIESRGKVVFDEGGVKVTAFLVHHEPAAPAYGYRVDYNGRSVTISGDTVPCEELTHYANGTDLLVHDAINHAVVKRMSENFYTIGGVQGNRLGKMMHDILDYHSNPDEAIDNAADANVKLLVLTHMVPPRRNAVLRRVARATWGSNRERNTDWKGKWIEADDGMMFVLKPAPSQAIEETYVLEA